MLLLLGVAFVAGVVTAISPCVLPVLPIVLAGGATGGSRRPYAIVAGLVASFTAFTLAATALLSALGLPETCCGTSRSPSSSSSGLSLLWPRLGELARAPVPRPRPSAARRRRRRLPARRQPRAPLHAVRGPDHRRGRDRGRDESRFSSRPCS